MTKLHRGDRALGGRRDRFDRIQCVKDDLERQIASNDLGAYALRYYKLWPPGTIDFVSIPTNGNLDLDHARIHHWS